jgi:hypothetical protein
MSPAVRLQLAVDQTFLKLIIFMAVLEQKNR